jgi:hypothetical protein
MPHFALSPLPSLLPQLPVAGAEAGKPPGHGATHGTVCFGRFRLSAASFGSSRSTAPPLGPSSPPSAGVSRLAVCPLFSEVAGRQKLPRLAGPMTRPESQRHKPAPAFPSVSAAVLLAARRQGDGTPWPALPSCYPSSLLDHCCTPLLADCMHCTAGVAQTEGAADAGGDTRGPGVSAADRRCRCGRRPRLTLWQGGCGGGGAAGAAACR